MRLIHTGATSPAQRAKDLRPSRALHVAVALAALALTVSACAPTATTTTPAATVTATAAATVTPATGQTPIKVYFSKDPDSLNNFALTFPVDRMSPSKDLKTFALQLLIAGPTPEERSQGYFSELNSILSGSSTCTSPFHTGPDLTVASNMKGSTPEQGTVTVKFCRASASPGIGADARISADITATLKQFSDVKKVVILNYNGDCFGDMSGQNLCLK